MYMHHKDGLIMELKEYKSCLIFFDVLEQGKTNPSSEINYNYLPLYSFLQTVDANKSKCIKRDVKNAESARTFMKQLGHTSQ